MLVFAVLLVVTELFVLSKLHVAVDATLVFVPSRLHRDACDPVVLSREGLWAASAAASGSFPSWAREGPFLEEAKAAETLLAADDAHR